MAEGQDDGDLPQNMSYNPFFEQGGPLSDPLERLAIFSALDSFR